MESQNAVGWKGPLGSSRSNPPAVDGDATQMLVSAQEMLTCIGTDVHGSIFHVCFAHTSVFNTSRNSHLSWKPH